MGGNDDNKRAMYVLNDRKYHITVIKAQASFVRILVVGLFSPVQADGRSRSQASQATQAMESGILV